MTEFDLNQYVLINKEIEILGKNLTNRSSDLIIVKLNSTDKLYLGPIIEKNESELAADIADIEYNIENKIKKLIDLRGKIEEYLDAIEDCEIRLIFRLRYIHGMSNNEIAAKLTIKNENGETIRSISADGVSTKIKRFFYGR